MSKLPSPASPDITLIQKAISFSARAHLNQSRKDGVTPYAAHPFRVFFVVRHVFGEEDPVALCAALLHDTIEDTPVDYDDVEEQFGKEVADAVAALTKDMRLPNDEREKLYDEDLAVASWQARLVKLGDVYDNFCDSANPGMRKKVVPKAERAIACAGDEPKLAKAIKIVRKLTEKG